MARSIRLKMFAALLLRAMAQEQTETGTTRVSPKHPNVARRLGLQPDSPELESAQRYLLDEDYIRPSNPGCNGGSFIITETGWEDLGYQPTPEGWRRRPWWKRMLGV